MSKNVVEFDFGNNSPPRTKPSKIGYLPPRTTVGFFVGEAIAMMASIPWLFNFDGRSNSIQLATYSLIFCVWLIYTKVERPAESSVIARELIANGLFCYWIEVPTIYLVLSVFGNKDNYAFKVIDYINLESKSSLGVVAYIFVVLTGAWIGCQLIRLARWFVRSARQLQTEPLHKRLQLGAPLWAVSLVLALTFISDDSSREPAVYWTLFVVISALSIAPWIGRVHWSMSRHRMRAFFFWCPMALVLSPAFFIETLARVFREDHPVTVHNVGELAIGPTFFASSIFIIFFEDILVHFAWYQRLVAYLQSIEKRVDQFCNQLQSRLWSMLQRLFAYVWAAIKANKLFRLLAVTVACTQLWACTMGPDRSYSDGPSVERKSFDYGHGYDAYSSSERPVARNYTTQSIATRTAAPTSLPATLSTPQPEASASSPAPPPAATRAGPSTVQDSDTSSTVGTVLEYAGIVAAAATLIPKKTVPRNPTDPVSIAGTAAGAAAAATEESTGWKALGQKALSFMRGSGPATGAVTEGGVIAGSELTATGAAAMAVVRWAVPLAAAVVITYELMKPK